MTAKARRFCLNFFAPPIIGTALFTTGLAFYRASFDAFELMPMALLVAYIYVGLPSLAHAFVLQRCYRRGTPPQSVRALLVSSVNGFLAGLAVYLFFFCLGGWEQTTIMLLLLLLGAATGAINALLHRIPCHRCRCLCG